ncbi:MAG: hypothetical protein JOZ51_23995 [Chloroflexi bacterium]|nr:hypothetical protein [Chloroflexota bacterium]
MNTLPEIEADVQKLAQRIGASATDLPTYGYSRDGGYPHVEVDATHYHYVVVERGRELKRKTTTALDELLYWIFADVTHTMAFSYELKHRLKDQDPRRRAFAKQIELLGIISPAMAARRASEIEEILKRNPYDDERIKQLNRMRKGN